MSGLTSENYLLLFKMLEIENHWVLDELIGNRDPFSLLSTIPPNPRSPSKRAGRVGHDTMGCYCQVMSKTVAGAPSHCLAVMDTL